MTFTDIGTVLLMTFRIHPKTRSMAVPSVLACVLFVSLSGCLGEGEEVDMEAFQQALDAPGETHTPDEMAGDTDFRVKVLTPEDPSRARTGFRLLAFLVYDAQDEMPVVDADIDMESWMITNDDGDEMDHGTSDESDPKHHEGGVYHATTNHFMTGNWEVRLDGEREGGDAFEIALDFHASRDS